MKKNKEKAEDCKHQWAPLTARVKGKNVPTLVYVCLKCGELKIGKRTIRMSRSRLDMGSLPIKNLGAPTSDSDASRRDTIDGKITTHKGDASAHHTATTRLNSKTTHLLRDMEAASGDVSYAGFGFEPTALVIISSVYRTLMASWGLVDPNLVGKGVFTPSASGAGTFQYLSTHCVYLIEGSGYQIALVKSYDADGFTLTWTKYQTPTAGTAYVCVLALR